MFFLSEMEQKILLNQLHAKARRVKVSNDLRGWSWYRTPLKPYYGDTRIPMYSVCSKYCPKGRDVYMNLVRGIRGRPNRKIILGAAVHETVRTVLHSFLEEEQLCFDEWYEDVLDSKGVRSRYEDVKEWCRRAWNFVHTACKSRFLEGLSHQPYASRRDVMSTAIPFLVEHRISGRLLGLSGLLKIDCFDYLRNIVFDVKVSDESRLWYRLQPTGYALVLESIYEIPVDVGCTVYASFKGDRLSINKDIFFISDDLRSWWVEERDEKLEMVAQKRDPGLPDSCYPDCIYIQYCRDIASK